MKCCDTIEELKYFSFMRGVDIIKRERNEFAESRQQWIQAAFNLAHHEDYTLFNYLVEEELCENCMRNYSSLKIEI